MDTTGIEIIVNAVVGKSLRKQEGCNSYIFDKVRARVWRETKELVLKGTTQLDAILTQKKRLQAIFTSEKLAYELTHPQEVQVHTKPEIELKDNVENYIEQPRRKLNIDEEIKTIRKNILTGSTVGNEVTTEEKPEKKVNKVFEKRPIFTENKLIVEEKKPLEIKILVNGESASAKSDENKAELESDEKKPETKKYFDYLAEYINEPAVDVRVKGIEVRGKGYPVSFDGSCPRCRNKTNVFVVLDFLFPAGDMPEILHYLLTLGKAVLWSSKESFDCKNPPAFLCQGKCPAEIKKCGFNINWKTTDLDKIFLFPEENFQDDKNLKSTEPEIGFERKKNISKDISENYSSSDDSEEEKKNDGTSGEEDEYSEGEVDIEYYKEKISWVVLDEFCETESLMPDNGAAMIRNMLALEEARYDFTNGTMKKKDDRTVQEYKNEFLATLPPPPPPPPKSPDKPKQSVVTVNGRKVTVDQILNDINNRLNAKDPNRLVPQDKSTAASKYILASSSSQTPKVFANTTPASYVVASNSINRTSTSTSVPTPTHILKGATYYNETKGSKDDKPAFTSNDFPISTDGVCPYCRSSDVVYIILQDDNEKEQFPDLLKWLFQEGKAVKRKKGEYDLPSFQCKACTYGFNLDWDSTNLENIFSKASTKSYFAKSTVSTAIAMQPVNTAMAYSAYNALNAQYMYNAYSYIPPQQPAFAMNAFGFIPPMVVANPFASLNPYQTLAAPFANYIHQYQSAAVQPISVQPITSQPVASECYQSFRERFPPPCANTEVTMVNDTTTPSTVSSVVLSTWNGTVETTVTNSFDQSSVQDMDVDLDVQEVPPPTINVTSETKTETTAGLYDPLSVFNDAVHDSEQSTVKNERTNGTGNMNISLNEPSSTTDNEIELIKPNVDISTSVSTDAVDSSRDNNVPPLESTAIEEDPSPTEIEEGTNDDKNCESENDEESSKLTEEAKTNGTKRKAPARTASKRGRGRGRGIRKKKR